MANGTLQAWIAESFYYSKVKIYNTRTDNGVTLFTAPQQVWHSPQTASFWLLSLD